MKNLSTDPYKGVRDFYPEDYFIQEYIFTTWRTVAHAYGYEEYSASLLEPTDLYRAKTGEEIVNQQTYSFTDRGGRDITLRPEMTPTVARMVAGKRRELTFPLRWFSIPNVFRYERPQKGRLREHWQLNVDLFGVRGTAADVEIITLADALMRAFGATADDFKVHINHRGLLNAFFGDHLSLSPEAIHAVSKLIDKKAKMPGDAFADTLKEIVGEKTDDVLAFLSANTLKTCTDQLSDKFQDAEALLELKEVCTQLHESGITSAAFDPSLVRGFDYYTGIVFEVFDTDPENNRSLFGGGRYDGLTEIFGEESVPAVGFGMGDVTIREFLDSRNLLPEYKAPATLYICITDTRYQGEANKLAHILRTEGINVAVDLSQKKIGDQVRIADKHGIPFVLCIGEDEITSKTYKVKNLATSEETKLTEEKLLSFFKK